MLLISWTDWMQLIRVWDKTITQGLVVVYRIYTPPKCCIPLAYGSWNTTFGWGVNLVHHSSPLCNGIISPSLAAVGGSFSVTVTLIFFHNFCHWTFKQLVLMYCSL